MKNLCLLIALLSFSLILSAVPSPSDKPFFPPPSLQSSFEEPSVPSDFDKRLSGSGKNWFQIRINQSVARAIRERKVSLEALTDYLFLMTVPNFSYRGEEGEERLGTDIMNLLGTIQTPQNTVMMELQWSELITMGLPFKKKLTDALLFPTHYFPKEIDLTFFVDLNAFTARVGAAFEGKPKVTPVYNSAQRFYRLRHEDLKCLFIVNITNIAYEIVYTGEPFENIIKRYLAEADFLFSVMGRYEKKIVADNALSYDGRYIKKGKEIFVDLWFLYDTVKGDVSSATSLMERILRHEPVSVSGSEKGGTP